MCGIVGYIGNRSAIEPVIEGLKALEYRGYDSAGISIIDKNNAKLIKTAGRVERLSEELSGLKESYGLAIGHTRWATHGSPTKANAHPHTNSKGNIFVVHNGIIENYQDLKQFLIKKGYRFKSNTDTEVIPQLIDYHLGKTKIFLEAFKQTLRELRGAYAIAAAYQDDPRNVYVAKLSSPLVIGVGKHEHIVASDISALGSDTKKVFYLEDYELAVVSSDSLRIHDYKKSMDITKNPENIQVDSKETSLGDFPHYMLKEIFESPQTVQSAIVGRIKPNENIVKLGGLESVANQLQYIDRIIIVACGTSYYAGLVGEYLIEEVAGIPVEVQLASEFKYRKEPLSRSTVVIAISQSGETADTIAALNKVEDYGILRLGIVNSVGSTIARMTDAGVYCHAGPEKSVASTKAFIAQVTVLAEIALYLSNGNSSLYKPVVNELVNVPTKITEILRQSEKIKKIALKYSKYRDFLFIGRGYMYPCALEGALKLKEVSYIHAEGYAAGEMKHGPLAMIERNFPTLALLPNGNLFEKTISNLEEIHSRKGPIIAIHSQKSRVQMNIEDSIEIPETIEQLQPLLFATVLQLFSYYIAVDKKLDVDKPRNLAKSVTVE
ncbi:glutamine--fructose-6-phosphate transaminase (isomerizing) [Candidatus Saccharibacteria bacterium]|nr:glutamine--fructose-6-phosphate transaminase (isomerizing) [Candidatus Saccharibacteria bacterium]